MTNSSVALQDSSTPNGQCFGCGPLHPEGLQIKSHWSDDGESVICRFTPDTRYIGWPGLVYGGLIAMLVDCHSNHTAIAYHYRQDGRTASDGEEPIECVTGHLGIGYQKPTPMGVELTLKAWVEGEVGRKSQVICEVWAGDIMTCRGDSVFVRVQAEKLRAQARKMMADLGIPGNA